MSEDATTSQGTPAPNPAPTTPAAPAQTAPAAAPTEPDQSPPAATQQAPDWLPERLARAAEQERQKLLSELGVDDPEMAKAAIAAAKEAAEKEKTTQQRLGETSEQLKKHKTEAERLLSVTKEWAARQMVGLTDEQRAAVEKLAGEDPAKQLEAITALTPTWAAAGPGPKAPAEPKPPTPATGTAPPPTAPAGTDPGSPPDHKAIHAELQKTNPFLAAEYAQQHVREVFAEKS